MLAPDGRSPGFSRANPTRHQGHHRSDPPGAEFCARLLLRGLAWRARKEPDKAIADFSDAIRLEPKDAGDFNNRGLVWEEKRDYDKAIADFDAAIRLEPKCEIYNNRGLVWFARKDSDKALADFKTRSVLILATSASITIAAWPGTP